MKKKSAVVTGGSGFIGFHLIKYLKDEGYYVRGIDIKEPQFAPTYADDSKILDLCYPTNCQIAMDGMDEAYCLAADMGGMGFIESQNIAPLYNSNLINTYSIEAAFEAGIKKYFFSSSVCVYPVDRQMDLLSERLSEKDAYPANPNAAYGWEKLTHEKRCQAYAVEHGMEIRIARFQNTYGPYGTYEGGREKAPAAICRKVALAKDGDEIEVWGDGEQTRIFMYVDDNVRGIDRIMHSNLEGPIDLGPDEVISINDMTKMIIDISGKRLGIKHVSGPQGVRSRHFAHSRIKSLGWKPEVSLRDGLEKTYHWIESEIKDKKEYGR